MNVCPKCGSAKIVHQEEVWICKKCGWKGKKPEEISDKRLEERKRQERREKKMKKLEKKMKRLGY
jgi:DNA-directed RNA polymerase subunit M/transcription elongation factor TFIIS